ncbi:MAG TPA: Lrp/AsnC ligand binding domain-containing protein [Acidobacteriota bacterium]|nr:Lrp/AsnC ligand binding domain-containing protein [Acidobacteriota bacterium]
MNLAASSAARNCFKRRNRRRPGRFSAFVFVYLQPQQRDSAVADRLSLLREVEEIHLVDQDDCLLLKVAVQDPEALASFLRGPVKGCPGVDRTRTMSVLRTVKKRPELVIS